jgi:serine protease Do
MRPLSFAPIAKATDRAVVLINTVGDKDEASALSGRRRKHTLKGLGTGFIVESDGLILTNNHVIEGADVVAVKLTDGRNFSARVIGRDAKTDLAVLRIAATDLPTIALGDSEALEVGDWVVAIGNPFGLDHTVSAGIVSAKGRTSTDVPILADGYFDFIQTDASINPGNSGGPLLNMKGQVVGINTAIRGDGQGIGFAIPMNMIREVLPLLLRDGKITRSAIGLSIRDIREVPLDERVQSKLVDEAGKALTRGAVVATVLSGGPGDKAGVVINDVIVAFDGQPVRREVDLRWQASIRGVGKTVVLSLVRQGKPVDVKVTLTELSTPARAKAPGR